MVQHRELVSIVSGCLILSNFSSALGIFIVTFFQEKPLHNFFENLFEILLNLMIQTFTFILGSVFWKLRLNDKRPDLLFSVHKSIVVLASLQLFMYMVYGFFNSFILNKTSYLIATIPLITLGPYYIFSFWKTDVLSNRFSMLKAGFFLDLLSILMLLCELVAKRKIYSDLENTNSLPLIKQGKEEYSFLIITIIIVAIPIIKVFYIWLTKVLLTNSSTQNELKKSKIVAEIKSLHFWTLVAAFASFLGGTCTIYLLCSAVFVGTTMKDSLNSDDNILFFDTHQKRGDSSF